MNRRKSALYRRLTDPLSSWPAWPTEQVGPNRADPFTNGHNAMPQDRGRCELLAPDHDQTKFPLGFTGATRYFIYQFPEIARF